LLLSAQLLDLKFTSSKFDLSLFIYKDQGITIFVFIYVDDIITTSSHPVVITQLINDLHSSFALKDLSHLNYFLGVEATWHHDGLYISQQGYIHDLLTKTNMLIGSLLLCWLPPLLVVLKVQPSQTQPCTNTQWDPFNIYLLLTPGIAFTVNKVSQFMQDPRDSH
jgi:hypothetical protein